MAIAIMMRCRRSKYESAKIINAKICLRTAPYEARPPAPIVSGPAAPHDQQSEGAVVRAPHGDGVGRSRVRQLQVCSKYTAANVQDAFCNYIQYGYGCN